MRYFLSFYVALFARVSLPSEKQGSETTKSAISGGVGFDLGIFRAGFGPSWFSRQAKVSVWRFLLMGCAGIRILVSLTKCRSMGCTFTWQEKPGPNRGLHQTGCQTTKLKTWKARGPLGRLFRFYQCRFSLIVLEWKLRVCMNFVRSTSWHVCYMYSVRRLLI